MPGETKITKEINKYIRKKLPPEPDVLKKLREETAKLPNPQMQISWEQAQFMTIILKAIRAKKILEIGVFTGYSTLITAMALPDDGNVIACDINTEWTDIAKKYWEQTGVLHKIDLRIAPASETLETLVASGKNGSFDFAFIDADKTNDALYYEKCLQLVKPGGLIMVDNALWGGTVLDKGSDDEDARAIQQFNDAITQDTRVHSYIAPVRDGILLLYKK
jgi:predicted O-methyltransferase YrrM